MTAMAAAARQSRASRRPRWDGRARQMWWCGNCIKTFRYHAANQRSLLDRFQQEGWPPRVDDPLPPCPGVNAKSRLRETVKSLNRGLRGTGVRFRMDGTGAGVFCETHV